MCCLLFPLVFNRLSRNSVESPFRLVALLSELVCNLNLKLSGQCWLESWPGPDIFRKIDQTGCFLLQEDRVSHSFALLLR